MPDRRSLIEMLGYCRPEGSNAQQAFCDKYLRPVFGTPDKRGNYIKKIGSNPHICFAAHHDTVHSKSGQQVVQIIGDTVQLPIDSKSSCLGADCTTGVWLILGMIEAGIEGVYVVHAAEEIGCLGSSYIVDRKPKWLDPIKSVISFDRYGKGSIITHQMGARTASDEFAESLSDVLNMPTMSADPGGSYTDSNEYSTVVSECTNISVGYYGQHKKTEKQDLAFAELLLERLIDARWDRLEFFRDPDEYDYYYDDWRSYTTQSYYSDTGTTINTNEAEMTEEEVSVRFVTFVANKYPEKIARMLISQWGLTAEAVLDDMGLGYDNDIVDEYLRYYG